MGGRMEPFSDDFLEYYYRELNYLRDAGSAFAHDFPNVAGRLGLTNSEATDPHVERLLESFAFLTARLHNRIDNVALDLTTALLELLYPHLTKPLPATAITLFQVNPNGAFPPPEGYAVPRHTELFTYADEENICRFRTVYPLTIFPIKIRNAQVLASNAYHFITPPYSCEFSYDRHRFFPSYILEVELESLAGSFEDFEMHEILFYLASPDGIFKRQLYQALFSSSSLIYCCREDEHLAFPMPPGSLQPMGFAREEMAIPPLPQETHAYQLLQEYFHFPEKFMFCSIKNVDFLRFLQEKSFLQCNRIKLLLPLHSASSEWGKRFGSNDIRLNCTPIVNLSATTTDPISIDARRTFYSLIPDARRDRSMEVYQIDTVYSLDPSTGKEELIPPYFTFQSAENSSPGLRWWRRTQPTKHKNVIGVDTEIAIIDTAQPSLLAADYVCYAKTLCTNRFLAEDLPPNTTLHIEGAAPVEQIICMQKPTGQQSFIETGENNTHLIAQLASNYVGFPYQGNADLTSNVKQLIQTHIGKRSKEQTQALLRALNKISVEKTMRRVDTADWRGMLSGIRVEVALNKTDYIHEWFLLAQVLHHYFAMNCQINTFVDLRLLSENIEVITFEDVLGGQHFI